MPCSVRMMRNDTQLILKSNRIMSIESERVFSRWLSRGLVEDFIFAPPVFYYLKKLRRTSCLFLIENWSWTNNEFHSDLYRHTSLIEICTSVIWYIIPITMSRFSDGRVCRSSWIVSDSDWIRTLKFRQSPSTIFGLMSLTDVYPVIILLHHAPRYVLHSERGNEQKKKKVKMFLFWKTDTRGTWPTRHQGSVLTLV